MPPVGAILSKVSHPQETAAGLGQWTEGALDPVRLCWKSYAAPLAGDGIDIGHIELGAARLFIQCIKSLADVHVMVVTFRLEIPNV